MPVAQTPLWHKEPQFQYFINSVLQLIFSIFRNNNYTSHFNSSTEGTLLKCLFQTAHSVCNSKDMDALKFQLVHYDTFYIMVKINRIAPNVWWILSIRAQCPIQVQQLILWGLLYLTSCFHTFWNNILSAMYVDWSPPHLILIVCYIFHLLISLPCKTCFYKDCNINCKNPVLDVIRALGTSNQAIYYNLLNICFSLLIDLDTLTMMSRYDVKIDAPYLWVRPLDFVHLNLAYGLL